VMFAYLVPGQLAVAVGIDAGRVVEVAQRDVPLAVDMRLEAIACGASAAAIRLPFNKARKG
jgi:hypothetical protein